jgi:hypothetical protein
MAKKKEPKLIDKLAADIQRVAKEQGIPAFAITKAKYMADASDDFTEWDLRKYGGFNSIKNTYFAGEEDKDHAQIHESSDLRRRLAKMEKQYGSTELMMRRIEDAVADLPPLKLKQYKTGKKKKKKAEPRTLNVLLSDLHFGSDLTVEEHGHVWGKTEEARAMAYIVKNICNYKLEYRDQTELVVNILGDIIENELHGAGSQDLLHIQTCRAMHLLTQAIGRFAENFPVVKVNFAVGNHGRDTAIHKKRATDQKFNALETTIYYGVKLACAGLTNVEFNQPTTPWVTYQAQGHNIYCTHGDTHLTPGSVGSKVDIKGLEGQMNKINAALKDKIEYKVFAVGHVHTALSIALTNGSHLFTNGALVPPNSFAQTLNIMEGPQIQVLWESTPTHHVGDTRFINAAGSAKDKSLDDIIKPFKELNQ